VPLTISMLKRWLKPVARTPLHPQWLVSFGLPWTVDWLRRHAHGDLVDIGCGEARLRKAMPAGVKYVGLDYPTTMALGYGGQPDVKADAARLPLADASIDTVVLFDVLEHLAEPEAAMTEAARVLRPGGKCLLRVPFLYPLHDEPHDYQRWTRHGLLRLLEAKGFIIAEITHGSSPCATAAALFSMALAKGVLDGLQQKKAISLAAPLILALVPLVNLTGWIMSKILPNSSVMPCAYRVVAVKA
jgi:SAM-dependent methyltransferase